MAYSTSPPTNSAIANLVNDEKFGQIYTPDEKAVELLNDERTVRTVKYGVFACALGVHSYSSGIHRIRIRIDNAYEFLGIRARNIPPIQSWGGGSFEESPSAYGWSRDFMRIFNGLYQRILRPPRPPRDDQGHVYMLTLNCDEHRLSIVDENTNEQDEMEVDVCFASFPWCLFVGLSRIKSQVSLL